MGRHYQKAIPMRPAYDEKLISFSSSLGDAICKGKTIPYADNDVTYALKLQNDRLKEKNIEMDFEVPYKQEGLYISIGGVVFLMAIMIAEELLTTRKRKGE